MRRAIPLELTEQTETQRGVDAHWEGPDVAGSIIAARHECGAVVCPCETRDCAVVRIKACDEVARGELRAFTMMMVRGVGWFSR